MGYVIRPKKKPIKHLPARPIWYGHTDTGQKIFMNALDAQRWSHDTGRPVFMKVKKYELD